MWQILAGAGLGALKNRGDQKKYEDQKKIQATTARWSPWTGMKHNVPEEPSVMNAMMQGAMMGVLMGKEMGAFNKNGGAATGTQPSNVVTSMDSPYSTNMNRMS